MIRVEGALQPKLGQIKQIIEVCCAETVNFSKHRPSWAMLSISGNVRLRVRVSVRLCVCSLLRYRLNVLLPPLTEVGCPLFLEIHNPWGKVMEKVVSDWNIFVWKWSKIAAQKKISFFLLILHYKTWWKPHFPMD